MPASTENSTGFKTFTATAAALAEAVRVKLDSGGLISAAGANEDWVGVTQQAIAANGRGTVKLRGAAGTFLVTASAGLAAGDKLFATAAGKVAAAGGSSAFTGLVAGQAAAGDGDIVEAVPAVAAAGSPELSEVVTATNAITAAETGATFYLNSATEFVSTLPAPALGLRFTFIVAAAPAGASYTVVTAASANLIRGQINSVFGDAGSFHAAGDTISFVDGQAVAGDKVELHCDGANWFAFGISRVAAGVTVTQAS